MAVKELKKPVKETPKESEKKADEFISKGGSLSTLDDDNDDHRLTLRIPKALMAKVDIKRKKRIGGISRNLFILEVLDKATKDLE